MELTKNCSTCGTLIIRKKRWSYSEWDYKKYCSVKCINLGRKSPFKGTTDRWSKEWKERLSKKNKGICSNTGRTHIKKGQHLSTSTEFGKIPAWNKGKKLPQFSGANSPSWKGGIYPEHLKERHSSEMKRWREEVFKRDNYTCVLCERKSKKGDKVVLNADHIKPFARYPELRLSLSNGRTLCRECHLKTDTHGVNLKK